MEWALVTWNLYRRVFARAAELSVRNWPVLGALFVYSAIMALAGVGAGLLGMAGGLVVSLVWAGCLGSFLYLVEMMVRTGRVTVDDFRRSAGAYLGDVLGVTFLLWIFLFLVTPAVAQIPQGFVILLGIRLVIYVLFNAVPELIYLGHHSSVQLLSESYAFISTNWIEWFPANLIAVSLVYGVLAVPLDGPLAYLQGAAVALLIFFTMVMRGLLFIELYGTSRRGRAFKFRSQG